MCCKYTHTCAHTHTHTHTRAHTHTRTHACTHTHIHTCAQNSLLRLYDLLLPLWTLTSKTLSLALPPSTLQKGADGEDKRVTVMETSTGNKLTGEDAPLEQELEEWLEKHPG